MVRYRIDLFFGLIISSLGKAEAKGAAVLLIFVLFYPAKPLVSDTRNSYS